MSMVKRACFVALLAGLLAAPVVSQAKDEAPAPVSASLDVSVLSAYVWRGQVLNDEMVAQPSLTVSKNGFTINWWANYNFTDHVTGDANEFSEHDISASYSTTCPLTGAGLTFGVVNYDFPNQNPDPAAVGADALAKDTRELFFTAAFSDVLLAPTLNVYYDFKEADGFYGSLGVSHSIELTDKASANLAASIGASDKDWNDYYYGVNDSAFNDWSVSVSVPLTLCENVTITPLVQYSALIDSSIKDAADGSAAYNNDKDLLWGGVKATVTF